MPYRDPEKQKAAQRAWYLRNKGLVARRSRAWKQQNNERHNQLNRESYRRMREDPSNRARSNAVWKRWVDAHPEYKAKKNANRNPEAHRQSTRRWRARLSLDWDRVAKLSKLLIGKGRK